jgi:hypothetical protein
VGSVPRCDEVDYQGTQIGIAAQPIQTEHAKNEKVSQP